MIPTNQTITRHRTGYETIGWLKNDGGESNHREHPPQSVRCCPNSSWNHPDPSERAPNSSFHPPFPPPDQGKNTRPNSRSVPMPSCDSRNRPNSYIEKLKLLRPPSPKRIQEVANLDLRVPCSCTTCSSVPSSSMHSIPCSSLPNSSIPYPSNTNRQQPERNSEGRSQASSTGIFSWEPRFSRMLALPSLVVPESRREEGDDGEGEEEEEEEEGWCQVTTTKTGRRCAVCGDSANGNFFGATVCLPCKSFFIRCTREGGLDIQKQCDGRCDVKRDLRHRCQYCRFQRCLQIGMKRKEKPEVVVAGDGQTLCRVCGDLANGVHFGVFTCEGCKKFFRRSLQEHRSYVCRDDGGCSLNPRNRNHCRRCRYLKCKVVGMSRDAIRMGRPRKCRSSRTKWQRIAFYSCGPAPSLQDSNPCHHSLHPPPPSPLGDSATKHPLSVTRDVQACGRRGAGKGFLTKHGYLPWHLPYRKRWSCPQKLGNRNNGFHELKIRSHRSVAAKPVPFSSSIREDVSSSNRSKAQSFSVSSSPPENSVQAVDSPSSYGHVHSTSLDRMARVTQHVLSTSVGAPLIRDSACVSTNSSVLSQSRSQQSLRPTVSSKRGPVSSLNPNSRPGDKPGHQLVTNGNGFTASQHGRCMTKHRHTAGVEHTLCRLCFPCREQTSDDSPQNLVLNTRPHSSSSSETPVSLELTGSKPQNGTKSGEGLQSRERLPSPWRTVGNVPEYSDEGLDLCLRKPSHGQSSFTKQAPTEVQHERGIVQEREIIPPRFTDSRIQSLNSTSTQPFSGPSVSVPNMSTEDSFSDRHPMDLSCSRRLRQSPSEHSLRQERVHTLQGSPLRAVEPVQQPTMRKNALINQQHCQDLNDRPRRERRPQLSEPSAMENSDNASMNPRRSGTGLVAEQDRGSRQPEFRPRKACSCQLSRPQVLQPAEPSTPCHVVHNEQTPSCPAPAVAKVTGDRVIRTLLDMNGQDLDKITGVVSGLITLLELIRDRKGLSRQFLSKPAQQ